MILTNIIDNESYESILKATFLLVLSVAGNFLAETLGCQTQALLDNMYAKHLLIFFVIYFTIDFTQDKIDNPITNVGKALVVWILFHFFTHMDLKPTIVVTLLFMALFFISNYRYYIKKNLSLLSKSEKSFSLKLDKKLEIAQNITFISTIVVILIGFSVYLIEKKMEYKNRFSIMKFIFGTQKCRHYTPKSVQLF